jgi:MOSC domain-containing protein YiiM
MIGKVISINVGKVQQFSYGNKQVESGIYKNPVNKPVFVNTFNIEGNKQADLIHHGGKDKAICVYCFEHYSFWEKQLERTLNPGTFGENLTVAGMTEETVCIGDIFQIGEALLQVSVPRQPCYKVAMKMGVSDLPNKMKETGFTGFYMRVLKEGYIHPHDDLKLVHRHENEITVSFVNQIKYHDKENLGALKKLANLEELEENWRTSFQKLLENISSFC